MCRADVDDCEANFNVLQCCNNPLGLTGGISLLAHVQITILDNVAVALVDSGTSTHIQEATGTKTVPVKQQVLLAFGIGGIPGCENVFLVIKDLIRSVILGMDWLSSVNASISCVIRLLIFYVEGQRYEITCHADTYVITSQETVAVTERRVNPFIFLGATVDRSKTIAPG